MLLSVGIVKLISKLFFNETNFHWFFTINLSKISGSAGTLFVNIISLFIVSVAQVVSVAQPVFVAQVAAVVSSVLHVVVQFVAVLSVVTVAVAGVLLYNLIK